MNLPAAAIFLLAFIANATIAREEARRGSRALSYLFGASAALAALWCLHYLGVFGAPR